jgi:hypothetical protein
MGFNRATYFFFLQPNSRKDKMAGDHHYEAPKTDGTYSLKVNWRRLSAQSLARRKLPIFKICHV